MIATAVATSFQSQEVIKVSKYLKDPQFLKTDPQFLKSAETPEKQPILGGKNCSWSLKKIFQSGNGCAMSFLQKKMEKFRQIWPQQPLKHFTAAYRGSPPCTQSQHPINRETGYSNVLGIVSKDPAFSDYEFQPNF